jgi:chromosomal replication initiator protein
MNQAEQDMTPALTFENFLEGDSNRLARLALTDLGEGRPLRSRSLLLTAPGPWGKTHLLTALARRLAETGDRPVLGLGVGAEAVWPEAWAAETLVIVDDVHLLAARPDLQQRLIQVFGAIPAERPGLVLSAPFPPGRLEGLSAPLRSRLGGGLVLSLGGPEYELMLALAEHRAGELGSAWPPEVLAALVRRGDGDPRRLLGLVETIHFIVSRAALSPAEALARLGPGDSAAEQVAAVSLDDILAGVATAFGLKVSDLTGHSRLRQAAWPRRVAMFLARELTRLTTTEIGAAFGGRDHSTIIHALKKINTELKLPSQVKLVENIKRAILMSRPEL